MYNVLTAIKNNMLLQELKRLHIWGASTGFEICEVTSDFATLTEHLRKKQVSTGFAGSNTGLPGFKPSADHPAGKALSGDRDGRADGGI